MNPEEAQIRSHFNRLDGIRRFSGAFVWILQGESELVAKDDNTEAGESNKDKKNKDKDNPTDNEDEREKVHEQVDEVSVCWFGLVFSHSCSWVSRRSCTQKPLSVTLSDVTSL